MINSVTVPGSVQTTHIVVRCFGLLVSKDSYFKEIGRLSSLYAYATSSTIKNEKRSITVMQSAPYPPNYGTGRPSTYVYDTLLESEQFEDIQDINPILVADIKCPENLDCKIQIKVFYSSTRTSGKEVLLAYTSFSLLDFLKNTVNNKSYTVIMQSEYCQAAKANLEIFAPFPKVLKSDAFAAHASKKPKNPLMQKYLLYPQYDHMSPKIDVLEQTWEPRHAFTIPLLFLDNIISAMTKSIVSWKQRQNLERMRQGLFYGADEATQRDWHELCITVHSAKFIPIMTGEKMKAGGTILMTLSSQAVEDVAMINGNKKASSSYSAVDKQSDGLSTEYIPANASIESTKKSLITYSSMRGGDRQRKLDESLPNTYIDINIIDSTQTFQLPVGRTNTEKYNLEPVYGSNVNASSSRKNTTMLASTEDVKLVSSPKSYTFSWIESPSNLEAADNDRNRTASDSHDNDQHHEQQPQRGSRSTSALSSDVERVRTSTNADLMTVRGEEVTFVKCIPHRSHTSIEFAVYVVDNTGKREVLGTCSMPLATIDEKTVWLPIQLSSEYNRQYASGSIRVTVRMTSPDLSNPSSTNEFAASSEFNDIFNYIREDSGAILNIDNAGVAEDLFEDYRHIIPECYSWLWHIGAYDSDPLAIIDNSSTSTSPTFAADGVKLRADSQSIPTTTSTTTINDIFLEEDSMTIQSPANTLRSPRKETAPRRRSSERATSIPTIKRVDCPLSLDWIKGYIQQLEALTDELMDMRRFIASQLTPSVNSSFRPSVLKKDMDVQALPINLHYQLLACRPHQSIYEPLEVEGNVTCGSFSPHGLGHKKGGLFQQENDLRQLRANIDGLKAEYVSQIRKSGTLAISRSDPVYELLQEIGRRYCKYESAAVAVAHRRILALSQAISVAVNAFHLKIGLVAEGYLSPAAAEQWLDHGMLMMFQGLLSVIANEKSMLEDTVSAVDALNLFHVKLCYDKDSQSDHDHTRSSKSNVGNCDNDHHHNDDDTFGDNASVIQSSIRNIEPDFDYVESLSQQSSPHKQAGTHKQADMELLHRRISAAANQGTSHLKDPDDLIAASTSIVMHGRRITMYIPEQAVLKLPASYQQAIHDHGGAIIRFQALLFTQGIDMQQTVASTFANESTGGLGLQGDVNMRGLVQLNRYCHIIQPINTSTLFDGRVLSAASNSSSGSSGQSTFTDTDNTNTSRTFSSVMTTLDESHIHPLVMDTCTAITNHKNNVKNIHMLAELERVCQYLRGCKITFCKSGKDRTGMVVTYEQARLLNEKYGLGYDFDGVIRLANTMRIHGTRLLVAEKNIGRKVFSINQLQAQFLPPIYRPPVIVCEDILKKDQS